MQKRTKTERAEQLWRIREARELIERERRIMREQYRLNQHALVALFAVRVDALTAFVVFRGKEETAAADLPRDLPEALRRLAVRLASEPSPDVNPA